MREQITMEDGYRSLLIKATSFLNTDKMPQNEINFQVWGKEYRIPAVRFFQFVKKYYTQEMWQEALNGYNHPPLSNRSRKEVMNRFIGAFLTNYLVILFDELQNGNTVEFGGKRPFLRISFSRSYNIVEINKEKRYLFKFTPRIIFVGAFRSRMRVRYIGRMNKMTFFQQIRKQLKYYNARIIYNS